MWVVYLIGIVAGIIGAGLSASSKNWVAFWWAISSALWAFSSLLNYINRGK